MAKVVRQNPGYHLGSICQQQMPQQAPIMNMQAPFVQQPMNVFGQPMNQPQVQQAPGKQIKL